MAALAQVDLMEGSIREIVGRVTPPEGVRLRRMYFAEDHSGDSAVYLVFGVSKKIPLTKKRVLELAAFSRAVTEPIWALPGSPIPYTRYEDAR